MKNCNCDVPKEIVICSAIKYVYNDQTRIIRGHRHADCIRNVASRPNPEEWKEKEQGFMTSKNRFVGRETGLELQLKAGIRSADPDENGDYKCPQLYSEDLY